MTQFQAQLNFSDPRENVRLHYSSTGGPRYMRSFYLRFLVYEIEKWPFSGTYRLIYGNPWSFICEFIICEPIFGVPISRI